MRRLSGRGAAQSAPGAGQLATTSSSPTPPRPRECTYAARERARGFKWPRISGDSPGRDAAEVADAADAVDDEQDEGGEEEEEEEAVAVLGVAGGGETAAEGKPHGGAWLPPPCDGRRCLAAGTAFAGAAFVGAPLLAM
mmetsp:Transcript_42006/g.94908  ORF Transcript_42006/g.94908 Transcript_42006/m.94908 type:complete len:139 (-) Transcript_42006:418-834(-)